MKGKILFFVVFLSFCAVGLDKSYGEQKSVDLETESFIKTADEYYSKKEFDKAYEFYKKAEIGNSQRAYYKLGVMYLNGEGIEKDSKIATTYFEKIKKNADGNDPVAQFYLGQMYLLGYGVHQSNKESAKWLKKAAEQEYAPSQYILEMARENVSRTIKKR